MPEPGSEYDPPQRSRLIERAQRTGTTPPTFAVGMVVLFAALAVLAGAPAIIDRAPQVSLPLIALAMTVTLLADLLRP
jgi:hypothetical protein